MTTLAANDRIRCVVPSSSGYGLRGEMATVKLVRPGKSLITVLIDGAPAPVRVNPDRWEFVEIAQAVENEPEAAEAARLVDIEPQPVPAFDTRFVCDHVIVSGGRITFGPAPADACYGLGLVGLVCRLVPTH